ncbi:MAG: efflux RND transporter periplasmic adaptor subunit [Vicinamibacterales bacterium]
MKRVAVTLVALLGIAAAAVAGVAGVARLRHGSGPSLPTALVARTTFVDYLQLRGEIRPVHSTVLAAPMSGGSDLQIIELAKNGTAVNAGDVIVRFDTTNQQRTLEQKASELKQAESEIEKALAEERRRVQAAATSVDQARSAASRARLDLEGADLRPRVDAEHFAIKASDAEQAVREAEQKVDAERASAAADVASARQKRDKARFDVTETERTIAGMTLRAPGRGPITVLPNRRAANVFAQSAPEFRPGDRAFFGAPIAELPDLSAIQMTCRIDEVDRARVQTDRTALVRVDALPDRELKGSVRDISVVARPDFTQFPPTRNFDLVVGLGDNDPRLRSGMSATARIELDRLNGVLVVPAAAVFQRGGATVYVVRGAEVEARRVTVLRRGRDQVALAAGVREGERVALKEPDGAGAAR